MPVLQRPDGVEIHWEARGEGPTVALAAYWNYLPGVYGEFLDNLAADHRVVTYDARGTGASTRQGPHDMDTGADDLAAVIEAAGAPAVVVAVSDSCNRAVRVGAGRPDLAAAVLAGGAAPISLEELAETEALVASPTVVKAFTEQLETDYRGGLRSLLAPANPQMSEEEVRERVARQVEYCPSETAGARLRAWAGDDPLPYGQEMGARLTMFFGAEVAGPWFPRGETMVELLGRLLPEMRRVELQNGLVSAPELAAARVRELSVSLRA